MSFGVIKNKWYFKAFCGILGIILGGFIFMKIYDLGIFLGEFLRYLAIFC